jgi:hypothetical protein
VSVLAVPPIETTRTYGTLLNGMSDCHVIVAYTTDIEVKQNLRSQHTHKLSLTHTHTLDYFLKNRTFIYNNMHAKHSMHLFFGFVHKVDC